MVWASKLILAALPQPKVPGNDGSYSQMPGILGGDVFSIVLIGAGIFLLVGGGVWMWFRLKHGGSKQQGIRSTGRRRRRSRSKPTLADAGGLPPLRGGAASDGGHHANQ